MGWGGGGVEGYHTGSTRMTKTKYLEYVVRDERVTNAKRVSSPELRAGCPRPDRESKCYAVSFDLTQLHATFSFQLLPGMDDTIDVVIVTRSLNDIDRREPRH